MVYYLNCGYTTTAPREQGQGQGQKMTTTITAKIPARIINKRQFPARTEVFEQDDIGRWTIVHPILGRNAVFESEVIDICKRALNWQSIKAAHFPMHGFSS